MSNNMKASDISEVIDELFGCSGWTDSRLFAYCMTRGELMLMTDGKTGRTAGRTNGEAVLVPVVCGQCERAIGGLGEGTGKMEIDEKILKSLEVFEKAEEWCGDNVEVVRQMQTAEAIVRAGAKHGLGMQTVVNRMGCRLEVANYLEAGFV